MVNNSLTAVIPIRDMSGKLTKVFQTILDSKSAGVQNILVVDTSIDGTYEELAKFLRDTNSQNVVLLSGNFGSAGMARNAGLSQVRTNFVTFWDSDDEPIPRIYLEAISEIGNLQNVMVVGNFEEIQLNQLHVLPTMHQQETQQLIRFARKPGIWRTIFSYDLVKELEFSPIPMGEDQEFLIQVLLQDPEVIFKNELFYRYHTGYDNQATGSKEKKLLNYLVFDSSAKRIREQNYQVPFPVTGMFIFQFLGMLKNSRPGISIKRIPNFFKTLFRMVLSRMNQMSRKVSEN